MDGRRARLASSRLDGVPTLEKKTPPRDRPVTLAAAALDPVWAAVLGIGWTLVFLVGPALQPEPPHPEMTTPPIVELTAFVFLVGLLTTIGAAALRSRIAPPAGVVTGLIGLGATLACPLSGHHQFGLWWIAQLTLFGGMLAASAAALKARGTTIP